ncbi:MAG: hypothetical protein HY652_07965 [Acidobacteria bacterium]|nr:hypothetical protein [Acidobacteriota bacterium]
MKLESGGGSLAEVQLTCSLLAYSAIVRVRLDMAETHFLNVLSVTEEQIADVVVGVLEAVKLHAPTALFKLYTFAIGLHGVIEGVRARDLLSTYTKAPDDELGNLDGSGAVFYYGETNERTRAAVTVDLSAVIENGLFVRPTVVRDASRVAIRSLPSLGAAFMDQALKQLRLRRR